MSSPAFTSANWKIRIYQTTYRAKHRSRMTIIGKPTANPMTIIGNPEAPPTATTGKPAANPTAAIGRLPTYHTAPRPEKTASFLFPFSRLPEIPHLRQSPDVHGATMWRTICDEISYDEISYNRIFCNKTRKISPLMVSAHRFRQTNTYNCTRCPQSARPSACRAFWYA